MTSQDDIAEQFGSMDQATQFVAERIVEACKEAGIDAYAAVLLKNNSEGGQMIRSVSPLKQDQVLRTYLHLLTSAIDPEGKDHAIQGAAMTLSVAVTNHNRRMQ